MPKKEQILELAKEKWRYDQIRNGNPKLAELEPEYDELLEGGYIWSAKMELMQSLESKHAKWLEKDELETVYEILFDLDEALKNGFFICGTRGSGKTNLAKWLVKKLIDQGVVVYVLDSSQAWLRNSPIENVITVQPRGKQQIHWLPKPYVFDISYLTIQDRIRFVNLFCKTLLNDHIQTQTDKWELTLFEEAQLYFPNGCMRSLKRYGNAVAYVTLGRNFKLGFGLITQFPANVDKLLVKLTMQRYFMKTFEPNDMRYIRQLIGKRYARILRDLKVGEVIYQFGSTVKKIVFPEFS